jgi:YjbE family integral membrane protein
MTGDLWHFAARALEIVWINLLLSGDNAVMIALACRSLPDRQRRLGLMLGAAAAVLLRIVFSLGIAELSMIPYLRLAGGMLLLWIAVRLIAGETHGQKVSTVRSLGRAVFTIVLADAVMSLDNVVAIAMAAKGSVALIVFGLALSIPLVVWGSTLVLRLVARFPALVWGGSALLGWIAGDIISDDPAVIGWAGSLAHRFDVWAPLLFAIVALVGTWVVARQKPHELDAA